MGATGLALNFIGAIIILFYHLPPKISLDGSRSFLLEGKDEEEIKKGKRYRMISRIGIILLAAGFLLQFLDRIICQG